MYSRIHRYILPKILIRIMQYLFFIQTAQSRDILILYHISYINSYQTWKASSIFSKNRQNVVFVNYCELWTLCILATRQLRGYVIWKNLPIINYRIQVKLLLGLLLDAFTEVPDAINYVLLLLELFCLWLCCSPI